jgi:hypothetical protein
MSSSLQRQSMIVLGLLLGVFIVIVGFLYFVLNRNLLSGGVEVAISSKIPNTTIKYVSSTLFEKTLKENATSNLKRVNVTIKSGPPDRNLPMRQGIPGHQYQYGYSFHPDTIELTINFLDSHLEEDLMTIVVRNFILGLSLQQKEQNLKTATVWDNPVRNSSHIYFEKFYYNTELQSQHIVSLNYE